MSSDEIKSPESVLRKNKRRRVNIACQWCRINKRKCDGVRPACGNCQKKESRRLSCEYSRGLATNQAEGIQADDVHKPDKKSSSCKIAVEAQSETHASPGTVVPVLLAKEINAAVNSRLGLTDGGRLNSNSSLFPMVNAPLYGGYPGLHMVDSSSAHSVNVLPQRRQADELLELYWLHIQPVDPLLDRERFQAAYRSLFAGNELLGGYNEDVFASTLNVVFAIATHLQISLSFEMREKISDAYFRRAWALIHPDTILWEAGSVEIVQCLILMCRFLHCTNNLSFTWMLTGCAGRMAQGLGLHMIGVSPTDHLSPELRWRKRVWDMCVAFDRQASIFLGRHASVAPRPFLADFSARKADIQKKDRHLDEAEYWEITCQLSELGTNILLSQMSILQSFTDRHDLLYSYSTSGPLNTILQFSSCLQQSENNLPSLKRWDLSQVGEDIATNPSYKQTFVLHMRLLHLRVFLFRHVLWYLCLPQSRPPGEEPEKGTMEYSMTRNYATFCVESAQRMIALIYEHHTLGCFASFVPWWQLFTYTYIAASILTAAMLRAELNTPAAAAAWDQAMVVLATLESLSPFIRQSRLTFQSLCRKILNSNNTTFDAAQGFASSSEVMQQPSPPQQEGRPQDHQTTFPDFRVDLDSCFFGMDDINWLVNLDLPTI
ncbi:hypothetical protein F5Y16DRAFT_377044 [Xylariaceae sp. FL0255]|nr:hypothetical protein F5Y16DRAFT_377044 [Xylariaceae sp. FL0255]